MTICHLGSGEGDDVRIAGSYACVYVQYVCTYVDTPIHTHGNLTPTYVGSGEEDDVMQGVYEWRRCGKELCV